jgi:hypothetical protein
VVVSASLSQCITLGAGHARRRTSREVTLVVELCLETIELCFEVLRRDGLTARRRRRTTRRRYRAVRRRCRRRLGVGSAALSGQRCGGDRARCRIDALNDLFRSAGLHGFRWRHVDRQRPFRATAPRSQEGQEQRPAHRERHLPRPSTPLTVPRGSPRPLSHTRREHREAITRTCSRQNTEPRPSATERVRN